MAEVVLKNLTKVFPGKVTAVKGLNLEIPNRQFLVLVGPSGCGKSTTLRMIAGLEDVTSGEIHIGGRLANRVQPKDRDIAMVFQNYALYPHMTVFENLAFGLKIRKIPAAEIRSRVGEAAEILDLKDLLDRKPKALSGGQRQRVAVGRAIVRKPQVFLFDEPLSNLDAKLRAQMRVEIKRLHARLDATMIYVTHDQVEAMTMGDRIVVMKDGLAQQVADPLTLYDKPANRFVAAFVGTPGMNFFEGQIVSNGGTLTFSSPGVVLPLPEGWRAPLASLADRRVALGVRPEDIASPAAQVQPSAPRIAAKVEVIEPLGSESHVYLNAAGQSFVCRADAHNSFAVGQEVSVPVDLRKAHVFAMHSGLAVI